MTQPSPDHDPTFVDLLELEEIDRDIFRGYTHAGAPLRTFGGQVAAQALVAAGRTAGDRAVHSLHSYFLRPGRPTSPIIYLVDRVRDGGSFTTRRVDAVQYGETIFTLSASFKRHEEGRDHQRPMPTVRSPEESLDLYKAAAEAGDSRGDSMTRLVLELRSPDPTTRFAGSTVETDNSDLADDTAGLLDEDIPRRRFWMRAADQLPDDPLLHVCALAYMSDLTLAGTATLRHDIPVDELMLASLDHAMWFHRPFRADQWLLFSVESPSSGDGRGLASGEFYTEDGRLVASVMQEALIRRRQS
jgi:acyl-CoA thioesterase-2